MATKAKAAKAAKAPKERAKKANGVDQRATKGTVPRTKNVMEKRVAAMSTLHQRIARWGVPGAEVATHCETAVKALKAARTALDSVPETVKAASNGGTIAVGDLLTVKARATKRVRLVCHMAGVEPEEARFRVLAIDGTAVVAQIEGTEHRTQGLAAYFERVTTDA